MSNYVTQVIHLGNGDSFEYVNYDGTWFRYGKNIQILLDIICLAYYNESIKQFMEVLLCR